MFQYQPHRVGIEKIHVKEIGEGADLDYNVGARVFNGEIMEHDLDAPTGNPEDDPTFAEKLRAAKLKTGQVVEEAEAVPAAPKMQMKVRRDGEGRFIEYYEE